MQQELYVIKTYNEGKYGLEESIWGIFSNQEIAFEAFVKQIDLQLEDFFKCIHKDIGYTEQFRGQTLYKVAKTFEHKDIELTFNDLKKISFCLETGMNIGLVNADECKLVKIQSNKIFNPEFSII